MAFSDAFAMVGMQEDNMWRERTLKVVLVLVGLLFLAGVYPVADSLWHANANHSDYGDDMMLSLYITLGIFLLLAARNPSANRSLIAFTSWSSFVHATVMSVLGFQHASERVGFLAGSAALVVSYCHSLRFRSEYRHWQGVNTL